MVIDTVSGFVPNPSNSTIPTTLITLVGDTSISQNSYINEYSAMTVPAFYSAVRFLTGSMASFGHNVFKDGAGQQSHKLNRILNRKASAVSSSYQTLETWYHHATIWGNGYLWIKRDMAGNPIALLNLSPEITVPFVYNGQKWFYVNFTKPMVLPGADVLHIALIGFDGIRGYPLVQLMRQSLEVGKYAERFSANYFKKGSFLKGAIEIPGNLTSEQLATMRESLRDFKTVDGQNAMELMILQASAHLNNSTIPNETSQLIETRKWQVTEVAQMLRVPPHVIYELSNGKWNTVEQQGAEVLKYTFLPWITQAEQALTDGLLTQAEQDQGLYIRIRTDSLIRGDSATLSAQVLAQVNGGIKTLNEGRRDLELPPIGPEGDKLRVPVSFPTAPNGGEGVTTGAMGTTTQPSDGDDTGGVDAPAGSATDAVDVPLSPVETSLPGVQLVDPNARPASYEAILEPILLDAVERVSVKEDKAFAAKEGKPEAELVPWGNVFAAQQAGCVGEVLRPIQTVAQLHGKEIDTRLIAQRYERAVKLRAQTGERTALMEIIQGVLGEKADSVQ